MSNCRKYMLLALVAGLMSPIASAFGGEDIAQGKPWHHEHITLVALTGSGTYDPDDVYEPEVTFSSGAAEAIAWHADNIDSYLYNPVFWAQGGYETVTNNTDSGAFQRTKAALVGFEDLAKLHFDDTFTNSGMKANWERYAMGTLIGLVWASELPEKDGVAAAHNILGVSFHAVQDFYSHSSWVSNTNNRCLTYFEIPEDQRNGMALFSGAYEKPLSGAPAHHGAYSLSCSVLKRDTMNSALSGLCGGISPIQNTSLCESYRACGGSGTVDARVGEPLFSGGMLIRTNPPGIALDNTALSRAQAPNRGLIDADGTFAFNRDGLHFPEERCSSIIRSKGGSVCQQDADQIFAGTKDLAVRGTMEWAEYLEESMNALGKGRFWNKVKNSGSADRDKFAQFENFAKLPYQFLSAGDYPVGNPARNAGDPAASARGWFLRLRIKTARNLGAGTDADIFARVTTPSGTQDVLLDYLPTDDKTGRTTNRVLVYNDFEVGDDDAYTIGPFSERPTAIALYNKSAGFGDVFDALVEDFSNGIDETLTDARQFLIGFIGGNADFVGSKVTNYTKASLDTRFGGQRSFSDKLVVNGGDEGHHEVVYSVTKTQSGLSQDQRDDGWIAVEIALDKLRTIEESKVDRGSNSDEPFVIFHIAPLNGTNDTTYTYMSPPFEDMDDGEEERFRRSQATKKIVQIPPEGIIVVSTAIYESDDENQRDRETLKTKFVTGMDQNTQRPAAEFTDTLGAAIAEDWTVDSLEVYAFHRSAYPLAGPVLGRTRVGDIDGGEVSESYELNWSKLTDFAASGVKPILKRESEMPDAKTLLHGEWHSKEYECAKELPYVRVKVEGMDEDSRDEILATKIENEGDECVDDIENGKTFRAKFEDRNLVGERYIVPPPRDRRLEYNPDDPLHQKPNWYDPSIDPNLGLEGNWVVMYPGGKEPYTAAVLFKGGNRECYDYETGCWYHFRRDPSANWGVNFWQQGSGALAYSEKVSVSGGSIEIDWEYGMHGHWGGMEYLSIGDQVMSGRWQYGNDPEDPENNGASIWIKTVPVVSAVEVQNGDDISRKPVGDPVTADTTYVGHNYYMRGNRSSITLTLYGDQLWGLQHVFMPSYKQLEVASIRYVCNYDGESGYPSHPNWKVCLSQGGVRGISVRMNVWPQAYSGEHILYVNDQEIPFNLNVINEPLRDAEWQPMEMEFQGCNVLQEVNRDYYDQPFRLVRQDFRPKEERGEME